MEIFLLHNCKKANYNNKNKNEVSQWRSLEKFLLVKD